MNMNGQYIFNPLEDEAIKQEARLVIYDINDNNYAHFSIIRPNETYSLSFDELKDHFNHKYKYQILDDKKWTDIEGGYKKLIPEIVDESGLKYVFYPSQNPSAYLVVCFQAIQTKPGYNYIRTLDNVNAHRLYIKDGYGRDEKTHSSYYLDESNPIPVDSLVQKLISEYIDYLQTNKSNTIFIGSSKGGYAALYHGYKFGAGHIVAGGPQVLLGDYLYGRSNDSIGPPIFKGIFGELTENNKLYANDLLFKVIHKSEKPNPHTYIHVGRKEPHYINHIIPFMKYVRALGLENIELDLEEYDTHDELAKYYPIFLKKTVEKIIKE